MTQTQALIGATQIVNNNLFSFDVGADYHLTKWLTPYFTFSDSYDPPSNQVRDPYSNESKTGTASAGKWAQDAKRRRYPFGHARDFLG